MDSLEELSYVIHYPEHLYPVHVLTDSKHFKSVLVISFISSQNCTRNLMFFQLFMSI